MDFDLTLFLYYSRDKSSTVWYFIARIYAIHDKIVELQLLSNVQGHMIVKNAGLDRNKQIMIARQTFGKYNVGQVASALRSTYKKYNFQCISRYASSKPVQYYLLSSLFNKFFSLLLNMQREDSRNNKYIIGYRHNRRTSDTDPTKK